jgi:hypothetical protein
MPDSSWPVLEDPSMMIFDIVALFPMMTMVMEMVVPTHNRLQPVPPVPPSSHQREPYAEHR